MAYFTGTTGADTYRGTARADRIYGAEGNDVLYGLEGDDQIFGEGGFDRLYGGIGQDRLAGGDGDDFLYGEDGDDQLVGGTGNDFLRGGAGADSYDGGAGDDQLSLYDPNANQGAVVDLGAGSTLNDGFGNFESLLSVENFVGGTFLGDMIRGSDRANRLVIDHGDTAFGAGGDDIISIGSIRDANADGGDGIDILDLQGSTIRSDANGIVQVAADHGIVVDLSRDRVTDDGFGFRGTVTGFEDVFGSGFDDRIVGSNDANEIIGFEGHDIMIGKDGADIIAGSDGNDRLEGGAGDDRLGGDIGDDVVIAGAGADFILAGAGADTMSGGTGGDTFSFNDGDLGTRTAVSDTITDFSRRQGDSILVFIDADTTNGDPDDRFTFIGSARFSGAPGELRFEIRDGHTFVLMETDGIAGTDLTLRLLGEHILVAADFLL